MLPIKTTFDDVDKLTKYLRSQVGWVEVTKAKSAIDPKHVDARKLDAMKYIGLVERDGNNIKLSALGQEYADGDEAEKALVLQRALRTIPLYFETIEWLHHSSKGDQTKTQIASYWHDNHEGKLEGAAAAALTDAVIFFMRIMDQADLSQFIPAGRGRPETYLKVDAAKITGYFAGGPANRPPATPGETTPPVTPQVQPPPVTPPAGVQVPASLSPGVHINLEIHIAADAKPTTVEEIFKNMRKYILNSPDSAEE